MELNLDTVGKTLEAKPFPYDWKTLATYALGIGAGPDTLRYVYEGTEDFAAIPSFAVVPTMPIVMRALKNVNADFRKLVHGSQSIKLHAPLSSEGVLHSIGRISEVQDKGKGAVVIIETETRDGAGEMVFETSWSIFCRGQGDFGGERGTTAPAPTPKAGASMAFETTMQTRPEQGALYRLSGDLNPLHIDPKFASKAGFERPILHGLASYGFAVRAIISELCAGDPAALHTFSARFSREVYAGDALTVRALPTDDDKTFLIEVAVGDRTVLSNGVVTLR